MTGPSETDAPGRRRRGRRAAVAAGLACIVALGGGLFATRGLIREHMLLRRLASGETSRDTIRALVELRTVRAIPILLEIAASSGAWLPEPGEWEDESRSWPWAALSIPAHTALEELLPKAADGARPALLAGLDSPRPEVRALAAELLGTPELGSPEVAERLVAALGDSVAQEKAERSLPRLGAYAVRPLVALMRGPGGPPVDAAQRVVRELGQDGRASLPALIARLEGSPASERDGAVEAIGSTCGSTLAAARILVAQLAGGDALLDPAAYALGRGCGGERATALLRQGLSDPDPARRRQVAEILGNLWPAPRAAAPELIAGLRDSDPEVRAAAAVALGRLEGDEDRSVAALAGALDDPESDVRWSALLAFLNLRRAAAIPMALVEQRLQDTSRSVRWIAAELLFRIRGPDPSLLPACLEELQGSRIPDDAVSLLVQLGPAAREAVPHLVKLLRNKDVRGKAARILGAIGAPAASAVPALLEALGALEGWDSHSFSVICTALAGIAPDDPRLADALLAALRGEVEERSIHAAALLWRLGQVRAEALEALIASSDRIVSGRLDLRDGKALGPEAVPRLLAALSDPAAEKRRVAAKLLPHTGAARSDVLAALAARMLDEDAEVGRIAFQALVELGGDPGSVLVKSFASPGIRRLPSWVPREIWSRKLDCRDLVPALEAALAEPRAADRFEAARCILWFAPAHEEAGRALAEAVTHDDQDLNYLAYHGDLQMMLRDLAQRSAAAVRALLAYPYMDWVLRSGPFLEPAADGSSPFVPPLAAALSSSDEPTRHLAAWLLKDSGAAGLPAVPALAACLDDPSPRVRARAALTLGAIGPAAAALATGALVRALGRRDDPLLRWNAACALADLGGAAREALPALVRAALDAGEDEVLRCLALDAMAAIDSVTSGGATLGGDQLDAIAGQGTALRRYVELLRPDLEEASRGTVARP